MKAKITVTAYSSENQEYLRGLASVTISDTLRLSQIKINEGSKGLYMALPQTQGKNTIVDEKTGLEKPKYYDVYCPITSEFGKELRDEVMKAFNELTQKGEKTLSIEADFKSLDNLNTEVTKVNLSSNSFDKKHLGYASVVFGGAIAVNGIRIREHEVDKPYVFMPSYYNKEKEISKDYCKIFGKDFGEKFEDAVRKAYYEKASENKQIKEASVTQMLDNASDKASKQAKEAKMPEKSQEIKQSV